MDEKPDTDGAGASAAAVHLSLLSLANCVGELLHELVGTPLGESHKNCLRMKYSQKSLLTI